jgi:hypothetical protein
MDNPHFRIVIELREVTEGDVTGVAQDIWDTHSNDLDAKLGDFEITVFKVDGNFSSDVDWTPDG